MQIKLGFLLLVLIGLSNKLNALTAIEQRRTTSDQASWALKAYNNPEVCDAWKQSFDKHISKQTKLSGERIELALAQITKSWEDIFGAEVESPAHYELLYILLLKQEEKNKRGSYKAFYDLKFNEHVSSAKKVLAQYPPNEAALAKDIAMAEEMLRLAELMAKYSQEKDKAIDPIKAAWFLALDRVSQDNPQNATELNSVVTALVSFNTPVRDKCKDYKPANENQAPQHQGKEPEIRRALPVDANF